MERQNFEYEVGRTISSYTRVGTVRLSEYHGLRGENHAQTYCHAACELMKMQGTCPLSSQLRQKHTGDVERP